MIDHDYIAADINRHYMVPMSKIIHSIKDEHLVRVNVSVDSKGQIFIIQKEGYRSKYVNKSYFSWLIYTGYIKVLDN